MQRYYFNFFDGVRWLNDSVGQEMEDVDKVCVEARRALIDMLSHCSSVNDINIFLYDVVDEVGKRVCRVTLSLQSEILPL